MMKLRIAMCVVSVLAVLNASTLAAQCQDTSTSSGQQEPTAVALDHNDPNIEKTIPFLSYLKHSKLQARYEKSKRLSDGAPGKSKTLERLMLLVSVLPWMKDEKIQIVKGNVRNRDYRLIAHTMVLRDDLSPDEQVLELSHQLYHVTNRLLTKLYVGEKLNKESFIDLQIWAEVASLLTETNIAKDLNIEVKTLVHRQGVSEPYDVKEVLKSKGMKWLHDLLFECFVKGSTDTLKPDYYATVYAYYDETYASEKPKAERDIEYCKNTAKIDPDCI